MTGRIRAARRHNGFASKREAMRAAELRLLERGGEIQGLRFQVKIPLYGRDGPILTPTGKQMVYIADAVYVDKKSGETVVEDSKGHRTETYQVKRAILAAQGVEVIET